MKKYGKWMNRVKKCMFCCLNLLLFFSQTVYGIDQIEEGAKVSLSTIYGTLEEPIVGAEVNLYKVADVYGFGEFVPTEAFASYPLQWNQLDTNQWRQLAQTLAGYIAKEQISPVDTGITDQEGCAAFPNQAEKLTTALYLVLSEPYTYENMVYTIQPTLICMPNRDSEEVWHYEEELYLKYEKTDEITELEVRKIWVGDETENHPNEIEVELYQGNELYESIVLNEENNWQYAWDSLKASYDWKIVENDVPDNYQVLVERDGASFLITNTYTSDVPEEPTLPQTGILWWPVSLLAVGGIVLFLIGWIKRRRSGE